MGALGRGCRGDLAPTGSAGPVAGDWLSGRAPRSHRGGHWFDPSIAHNVSPGQKLTDSSHPTLRMGAVPVWEEFGRSFPPPGRPRAASQQGGFPLGISFGHGAERREQIVEQRNAGARSGRYDCSLDDCLVVL